VTSIAEHRKLPRQPLVDPPRDHSYLQDHQIFV
jgi:hypothetical protein